MRGRFKQLFLVLLAFSMLATLSSAINEYATASGTLIRAGQDGNKVVATLFKEELTGQQEQSTEDMDEAVEDIQDPLEWGGLPQDTGSYKAVQVGSGHKINFYLGPESNTDLRCSENTDDTGTVTCQGTLFEPLTETDPDWGKCKQITIVYEGGFADDGKRLEPSSKLYTYCPFHSATIQTFGNAMVSFIERDDNAMKCIPIVLIMGILVATMYYAGRDPLSMFDISAPKLPKGKKKRMGKTMIQSDFAFLRGQYKLRENMLNWRINHATRGLGKEAKKNIGKLSKKGKISEKELSALLDYIMKKKFVKSEDRAMAIKAFLGGVYDKDEITRIMKGGRREGSYWEGYEEGELMSRNLSKKAKRYMRQLMGTEKENIHEGYAGLFRQKEINKDAREQLDKVLGRDNKLGKIPLVGGVFGLLKRQATVSKNAARAALVESGIMGGIGKGLEKVKIKPIHRLGERISESNRKVKKVGGEISRILNPHEEMSTLKDKYLDSIRKELIARMVREISGAGKDAEDELIRMFKDGKYKLVRKGDASSEKLEEAERVYEHMRKLSRSGKISRQELAKFRTALDKVKRIAEDRGANDASKAVQLAKLVEENSFFHRRRGKEGETGKEEVAERVKEGKNILTERKYAEKLDNVLQSIRQRDAAVRKIAEKFAPEIAGEDVKKIMKELRNRGYGDLVNDLMGDVQRRIDKENPRWSNAEKDAKKVVEKIEGDAKTFGMKERAFGSHRVKGGEGELSSEDLIVLESIKGKIRLEGADFSDYNSRLKWLDEARMELMNRYYKDPATGELKPILNADGTLNTKKLTYSMLQQAQKVEKERFQKEMKEAERQAGGDAEKLKELQTQVRKRNQTAGVWISTPDGVSTPFVKGRGMSDNDSILNGRMMVNIDGRWDRFVSQSGDMVFDKGAQKQALSLLKNGVASANVDVKQAIQRGVLRVKPGTEKSPELQIRRKGKWEEYSVPAPGTRDLSRQDEMLRKKGLLNVRVNVEKAIDGGYLQIREKLEPHGKLEWDRKKSFGENVMDNLSGRNIQGLLHRAYTPAISFAERMAMSTSGETFRDVDKMHALMELNRNTAVRSAKRNRESLFDEQFGKWMDDYKKEGEKLKALTIATRTDNVDDLKGEIDIVKNVLGKEYSGAGSLTRSDMRIIKEEIKKVRDNRKDIRKFINAGVKKDTMLKSAVTLERQTNFMNTAVTDIAMREWAAAHSGYGFSPILYGIYHLGGMGRPSPFKTMASAWSSMAGYTGVAGSQFFTGGAGRRFLDAGAKASALGQYPGWRGATMVGRRARGAQMMELGMPNEWDLNVTGRRKTWEAVRSLFKPEVSMDAKTIPIYRRPFAERVSTVWEYRDGKRQLKSSNIVDPMFSREQYGAGKVQYYKTPHKKAGVPLATEGGTYLFGRFNLQKTPFVGQKLFKPGKFVEEGRTGEEYIAGGGRPRRFIDYMEMYKNVETANTPKVWYMGKYGREMLPRYGIQLNRDMPHILSEHDRGIAHEDIWRRAAPGVQGGYGDLATRNMRGQRRRAEDILISREAEFRAYSPLQFWTGAFGTPLLLGKTIGTGIYGKIKGAPQTYGKAVSHIRNRQTTELAGYDQTGKAQFAPAMGQRDMAREYRREMLEAQKAVSKKGLDPFRTNIWGTHRPWKHTWVTCTCGATMPKGGRCPNCHSVDHRNTWETCSQCGSHKVRGKKCPKCGRMVSS